MFWTNNEGITKYQAIDITELSPGKTGRRPPIGSTGRNVSLSGDLCRAECGVPPETRKMTQKKTYVTKIKNKKSQINLL